MMRALGLSVLFVLVVAAIVYVLPDGAPKPKPAPAQFAPLVPAGETSAPPDAAFREECLKSLQALTAAWTFSEALFTRSKEWGLVMRADYTSKDIEGPNVNRVICSRGSDGKMRVNVTMGQKVPPLMPPSR